MSPKGFYSNPQVYQKENMIFSFAKKRDSFAVKGNISVAGFLLLHGGERQQGRGVGRRDQGWPGGDQQNLKWVDPEEINKS